MKPRREHNGRGRLKKSKRLSAKTYHCRKQRRPLSQAHKTVVTSALLFDAGCGLMGFWRIIRRGMVQAHVKLPYVHGRQCAIEHTEPKVQPIEFQNVA